MHFAWSQWENLILKNQEEVFSQVGWPYILSFIQVPRHHGLQKTLSIAFSISFLAFFFFKSSNNRNCSDSMNIRRKSFAWLINLTGTCEHLLFVGCQVRVPWEMSRLWSPCSPEAHNLELQSLWTSPLGGHPDRCGGMQLLSAQVEEKHIVQVMTLDNLQRR